ncbi:hypothetical protein BDV25DRAFT_167955 [Aspergillus avenaceus]|uniref:Uncharacterized protein n=1 Tax=Aspergillus avenaceus TaxID=36643 RepID=A0A5N6TSE5_ASPAV|nr:hypothetical protein BDV25DRAFT_167955 [Aspergillus avenaceus]
MPVTRSQTSSLPSQPPKQSAYKQSTNPVSKTPQEQRSTAPGTAPPKITRGPDSRPAENISSGTAASGSGSHDVDVGYGVEQQPAEGDVVAAVEGKSEMARERLQAGAHAGPVGSMYGPGVSGGDEADMDRKRVEHDRVLGERVGMSPAEPDEVRREVLEGREKMDVKGAVGEGSGGSVV